MIHTFLLLATFLALTSAASLQDVCTEFYARSVLPFKAVPGIRIDQSSLTAEASYHVDVGSVMYPSATTDYCNVTFAYSHADSHDRVLVTYWLPDPSQFSNRFLSTGGGGLAINQGSNDLPGGIIYGAAAGLTDGGFGGFDRQFSSAFLSAPGQIDWDAVRMFGYQAIHEMTLLGQQFTKNFFEMGDQRLYRYYQGCSEGGREAWSQIQRFATFDGAITGAPAFRYAMQQTQHLWSNVAEQALGYYPEPCEMQRIANATVEFCDPLDGKTDGVVARSDLCRQRFDYNSTIGLSFSCPMSPATPWSPDIPQQEGLVSPSAAELARQIVSGIRTSSNKLAYLSYEPSAATFADATTSYNPSSHSWDLTQSTFGGEWIERFLLLHDHSHLPSLRGITADTLRDWMAEGLNRYDDTLQTTKPNLSLYRDSGGKILHFHGDADDSIPAASSVRYYNSVRMNMHPHLSYRESSAKLSSWYKLYLVPGAAHCNVNPYQPNGPFPQTNLAVMIDWVENGVEPQRLNATVLQGEHEGREEEICEWPLRPGWTDGQMECRFDEGSLGTWDYYLDAYDVPIY